MVAISLIRLSQAIQQLCRLSRESLIYTYILDKVVSCAHIQALFLPYQCEISLNLVYYFNLLLTLLLLNLIFHIINPAKGENK